MPNLPENAIVNLNGLLMRPSEAKVSVFDRSYLYGDSLYEVIRTYNGRFAYMEEHLIRLAKSTELCRLKLGQSLSHYKAECERALQAFQALPGMKNTEAYCRIVVSRGTGKIGFGLENLLTPTTYAIIVQPLNPPTAEKWEQGFRYQISPRRVRNAPNALDPAMKSGNYLNSLLAFLEGAELGYEDALLCDQDGFLTEGTTFNIFYVRRGIVATPPLDVGILDGITRRNVIRIARELGIEAREVRFTPERLFEADEVFMTSTIKEVFPVTELDGKKIRGGKPGPITRRLAEAFHADAIEIVNRASLASRALRGATA